MRVHFHSDCYWFSGSETTLVGLLSDAFSENSGITASFSYRAWPEYDRGLRAALDGYVDAQPLRLPDPADLRAMIPTWIPQPVARAIRGAIAALPVRHACLAIDVVLLWRLLRQRRPDVLHVNNGGMPGAISCNAASIAGRLLGIPVVHVVNNIATGYRGRPTRWMDWPVDRLVSSCVTRYVTGSDAAGRALESVLRIGTDRREVIPNSVRERAPGTAAGAMRAALRVPDGGRLAVVVARLEARKGHRHLLDAVALLPTEIADRLTVVLAGDGPLRADLERRTVGQSTRVVLVGPYPDPWSLYQAADLVVLPSIANEDFPITILEAMASGRPVVATTVAGIPEQVVHGITGILVPPADPARLASAMAELLGDPERADRMGRAGRARFEACYTPERAAQRYRALWTSATHRTRGATGRVAA